MSNERTAVQCPADRSFLVLSAGVALVALVSAASAGCVVNEPETPARGVVVSGPPPAPVREERPPAPGPQAAWVGGYWHWTGMQYAWIPGHWEAPPPGAVWNAPAYTARDGKYFYETGGWNNSGAGTSKNAIR
ncbi:MAG: hypothetical protein JWP97_422 [Labilithrix sp.]|nr:hypothetical protein [Labilithrix sp.]